MTLSTAVPVRPFYVSVAPRVCGCKQKERDLGKFKRLDRALKEVEGYWNVFVGFFGEQQLWLDFTVVDLRDGSLIWRNGRLMKEEDSATENTTEGGRGTAGRNPRAGEWIGQRRDAHGW